MSLDAATNGAKFTETTATVSTSSRCSPKWRAGSARACPPSRRLQRRLDHGPATGKAFQRNATEPDQFQRLCQLLNVET